MRADLPLAAAAVPFQVSVEQRDDHEIDARIRGGVDAANARCLERVSTHIPAGVKTVRLDLSGVTLFTAAGCRALIHLASAVASRPNPTALEITTSAVVHRVLTAAGLETHFDDNAQRRLVRCRSRNAPNGSRNDHPPAATKTPAMRARSLRTPRPLRGLRSGAPRILTTVQRSCAARLAHPALTHSSAVVIIGLGATMMLGVDSGSERTAGAAAFVGGHVALIAAFTFAVIKRTDGLVQRRRAAA